MVMKLGGNNKDMDNLKTLLSGGKLDTVNLSPSGLLKQELTILTNGVAQLSGNERNTIENSLTEKMAANIMEKVREIQKYEMPHQVLVNTLRKLALDLVHV